MLRKISFNFAVQLVLLLLALVILFHILVILQLIPFAYLWGGQLKSVSDMYKFETISIAVNLFIFLLVWWKKHLVLTQRTQGIVQFLLWLCVALFALNTFGNILAEKNLETLIFTPITLLLTVLCIRIAIEK